MRRVLVPYDIAPLPPAVNESVHRLQGLTMGTTWSVSLVCSAHRSLTNIQHGIEAQLQLVIDQMSTWEPDAFISRYNQAAADTWHDMPAQFAQVLSYALAVAKLSNGAYDPSAGPLVNAWGFGPEPKRESRPSDDVLLAAKQRTGWQRIKIDNTRLWQPGGLYLDFSAIAKGYAVDLVSSYLQQIGIRDHLVEVGGELLGMGIKPDAQPWWVELERPPTSTSSTSLAQHVIALHGLAVATSGDYRKYFDRDGQRYCHTIDPRTGEPIQHHLAAISVIHRNCMMADALSTALNVLGPEVGLAFANQHELAALFVVRTGTEFQEHMSAAFAALLQ